MIKSIQGESNVTNVKAKRSFPIQFKSRLSRSLKYWSVSLRMALTPNSHDLDFGHGF